MIRGLALLLLAMPLAGQQAPRADVFGLIGIGKVYDDEGSLGSGAAGSGGVGYRLRKRLGVEAEFNGFRSERDIGGGFATWRNSGVSVMGNALSHFGSPRAQFYLLGGVGLLRAHNGNFDRSGAGLNIGFGFGFKFYASEHVYIRPDFRIFGGNGGGAIEAPVTMMRVAIGAGYSW